MLTKGAYKYLKYVVDMVENGEKMVKFYYFLKNGEMVKNGYLNLKFFSHKYFISSLECISIIVYTNVENHLFSSLVMSLVLYKSQYANSMRGVYKKMLHHLVWNRSHVCSLWDRTGSRG